MSMSLAATEPADSGLVRSQVPPARLDRHQTLWEAVAAHLAARLAWGA